MRNRLRTGWLVAAVVACWASSASAQLSSAEGRALEFRTDLPWGRLSLEGHHGARGPTPLRVPGPLRGEFWLTASGAGVESQRGQVRVGLDELGSQITSYGRPSSGTALRRSLVFPGFHQLRIHETGKGLLMGVAGATSAGMLIWSELKYRSASDDTDTARRAFEASGVLAERIALQRVLSDRREDENRAVDRRNLALIALGAAWGVSAIDALLFAPDFEVRQVDANSLTIGMRPKTRVDAAVRSMVFPGLGQRYNGESTKAGLVAVGGLAAAGLVFYKQDRYLDSVAELNKSRARFESATTVAEQNEFFLEQEARFADSEDRYRDRNTAVAIAATYWGLSVLDAILAFGEPWGGERVGSSLGLTADPLNGALAAQVTF